MAADLTRLTVNLVPDAMAALDRACERTGDDRTDTVNRALLGYDQLLTLAGARGGRLRLLNPDGTQTEVKVL
jgi:hypothetical protein